MYRVERSCYTAQYDHHYEEQVIPLTLIRRSCHLIPEFGNNTPVVDDASSLDPLELFKKFYVNSYFDLHMFQILI
jgi:hypothetical protein